MYKADQKKRDGAGLLSIYALQTLGKIGQGDAKALQAVIDVAKTTPPKKGNNDYFKWTIRQQAVAVLGEFDQEKEELRKKAINCLIGVLSEVQDYKPDPTAYPHGFEEDTQMAAIGSVGRFGPDAKDAPPILRKAKAQPLHGSPKRRGGCVRSDRQVAEHLRPVRGGSGQPYPSKSGYARENRSN